MSLSGVKKYLDKYGLAGEIIELDESSATVAEAASALHTEEDRIAKSLSFYVEEKPIVIVVSGNSKIDNRKYKTFFHKKARMLPFDDVEDVTTHPVGGVCPFDLPKNVSVYLDNSLKKYETVFPACGSPTSAMEISVENLEKVTNYPQWIDVTKSLEE